MFAIRQRASCCHQGNSAIITMSNQIRKFIRAISSDRNSNLVSGMATINHSKSQLLKNMELISNNNAKNQRWLFRQVKNNDIRFLSTVAQTSEIPNQSYSFLNEEESKEFTAVFPDIIREISFADKYQPDTIERITETIKYTVPLGKKNRGIMTVIAYKIFEKPELLTPENIRLAQIVGWCTEFMNGFLLVTDDLVDGSETRRGGPCWYRRPGIGVSAVNDAMLLENDIYYLLKSHLKDHPSYVHLLELFHHATSATLIGQITDTLCMDLNGKPKLHMFTMDRYKAIAQYKTAYYSFYLSIGLAMHLAKIHDEAKHRQVENILLDIGILYQIQNDHLDWFGDPSITGKIGTDIQEGNCSWFAVVALQKATAAQRKIMEDYYGRSEPESIARIEQLYEDLGLKKAYAKFEEENYNRIKANIHQMPKDLHPELYIKILNRFYKRNR